MISKIDIASDNFKCMVQDCKKMADHILPDEDQKPFSICSKHLLQILNRKEKK